MASEREKKEAELGRNRFDNVGQTRRLHAIDAQVEKERLKVKTTKSIFLDNKKKKSFLLPEKRM
jgi:hypothetical protein